MAIAFSAAVALLALAAGASAPPLRTGPPIGITVTASRSVPKEIVAMTLAEAESIWRRAGFTFAWHVGGPPIPTVLRVTIDEARRPSDGSEVSLGWVVFDDDASPEPDIHLSYASAVDLFVQTLGVGHDMFRMPLLERDTMLSRALGRALAHELGHYLLGSKAHTGTGLMQTRRSAADFFGPSHANFGISSLQRAEVAARLSPTLVVGSR
ncbi:MAG TPA: hypothetical protein VL309_11160 [Vicinamibacterales bacterium]|jgi:hypothetical protein|nr:hypothetical protein [Vicinamibacterales bacterium]